MNSLKSVLSFSILLLVSMHLFSCSCDRARLFSRNDDTNGENRLKQIIHALENNDPSAIKKMFSVNTLHKSPDIDSDIDYIMNFYRGKYISHEGAHQAYDRTNDGDYTIELKYFYRVTTDQEKYIIFFIDQYYDTIDKNNEGLRMLQIIKLSERDKEFDWGNKTRRDGIYRINK